MELKKVLYRTVHGKRISVEQIADLVGCSASLLYRTSNPNDITARFPLEKLLALMFAVKDFSILKHLAARAGFILYQLPGRVKYNKTQDLNKFQMLFSSTFQAILDFKNNKIEKEECLDKIDRLLTSTIEVRKSVETSQQLSFDFKDL
jgi:uncharacterized protein YecE (DUF72 family)